MAHDVFISYASEDKSVADAVCFSLEARGIRCWIAPRDVLPGENFGESILAAIGKSRFMLFILSSHSNNSAHVSNEVLTAVNSNVTIIPFRIEDVFPEGALKLHLASIHWLDAITRPLDTHLETLAARIEGYIEADAGRREDLPPPLMKEKMSSGKIIIATGAFFIVIFLLILWFRTDRGKALSPNEGMKSKAVVMDDTNKRRIDELVTLLVKNFRDGKIEKVTVSNDSWSSAPITMVFLDIKSTDLQFSDELVAHVSEALHADGRVNMIERELLTRLLEELKLSTSELADPATALKIGKLLSTRVIVTGRIKIDKAGQVVLLRLIDTETGAVKDLISAESKTKELDTDVINSLSVKILDAIRAGYPIRGRVTALEGDKYQLNLGQSHGLKKGDILEVVTELGKGGDLYGSVGELKIVEAGKTSSLSLLASGKAPLIIGVKVREKEEVK